MISKSIQNELQTGVIPLKLYRIVDSTRFESIIVLTSIAEQMGIQIIIPQETILFGSDLMYLTTYYAPPEIWARAAGTFVGNKND